MNDATRLRIRRELAGRMGHFLASIERFHSALVARIAQYGIAPGALYSIALDLFIAAYTADKMPLPPPQTISQLK